MSEDFGRVVSDALDDFRACESSVQAVADLLAPAPQLCMDTRDRLSILLDCVLEECRAVGPPVRHARRSDIEPCIEAVRDLLCPDLPFDMAGRHRLATLLGKINRRQSRAAAVMKQALQARSFSQGATHPEGDIRR